MTDPCHGPAHHQPTTQEPLFTPSHQQPIDEADLIRNDSGKSSLGRGPPGSSSKAHLGDLTYQAKITKIGIFSTARRSFQARYRSVLQRRKNDIARLSTDQLKRLLVPPTPSTSGTVRCQVKGGRDRRWRKRCIPPRTVRRSYGKRVSRSSEVDIHHRTSSEGLSPKNRAAGLKPTMFICS